MQSDAKVHGLYHKIIHYAAFLIRQAFLPLQHIESKISVLTLVSLLSELPGDYILKTELRYK